MKIFRSAQIRQIDNLTIKNEPVESIDLMERAAASVYEWYKTRFSRSHRVLVFTGPGNNGGDGLALARMLYRDRYEAEVLYVHFTDSNSNDWKINRERLLNETNVHFKVIDNTAQLPLILEDDIVIDAIFGSGLSRPVDGLAADIIRYINESEHSAVISIDVPSGLFCEDNNNNNPDNIIKADYTLSFQFPKLAFMFSDNHRYIGAWTILPIGLNQRAILDTDTPYELIDRTSVARIIKKRNKFDHKGNFGHGLLIGGSYGKMGAVILGSKAALRSGAGLVTCHIPSCGNFPLQAAVPEVMVIHDKSDKFISDINYPDIFDSFGIGPGMGTTEESHDALKRFLVSCKKPLVIDADALNILSANKQWLSLMPEKCILTPHPGEFARLAGKTDSGYERLEKQIEFSKKNNCIIVLKGAHTSVTTPSGDVWFNSTGNPGMATAGSGDVLTGMILSLLAQDYNPADAAVAGVFLHGLAGDIAAVKTGCEALIASDIIDSISGAFNRIRDEV